MEQLIQNTNDILNEIKNMSTLPSYLCAIATFLAAIVALFKDEISNVLFGPKISTNIDSLSWQENLIAVKKDDDADDDGAVQKACNYTLDLKVLNEGKRTCRECEFYLNKIEFKHSTNDKYEKLLEINENKPLWISYEKIKKTDIGPYGKSCQVRLAIVGSPSSRKEKKGSNSTKKPELIAGSVYLNEDQIKEGFYRLSYSMFSTNYKRINFIVEIQWDAKWANRMTEMKLSVVRGDV